VLESGSSYLTTVAPFYPLLAVSIALYFASHRRGDGCGGAAHDLVRCAHRLDIARFRAT
jgi:hypothetical protein